MSVFEGNQQILNLYSEIDRPKQFFPILRLVMVFITLVLGIGMGLLGYLAFGKTCKSTILFNMPEDSKSALIAQILYVVTILGSFVMLA